MMVSGFFGFWHLVDERALKYLGDRLGYCPCRGAAEKFHNRVAHKIDLEFGKTNRMAATCDVSAPIAGGAIKPPVHLDHSATMRPGVFGLRRAVYSDNGCPCMSGNMGCPVAVCDTNVSFPQGIEKIGYRADFGDNGSSVRRGLDLGTQARFARASVYTNIRLGI